ncbi:MAG TPA: thioredoxin domain-containing protein [Thermoanaerobaculia bacterium]|nr:thioredoxin domain-containing protein [Thermoanaerobaculia bacterium]
MARSLALAAIALLLLAPASQAQEPCAAPARKVVPCGEQSPLAAFPLPVATLDDTSITVADLDEATRKKIDGLDAAIAEARTKALRQETDDYVLDREALRRGASAAQVLETEVLKKVSWPSEADLAAEIAAHPEKYKRGKEDSERAAANLYDRRLAAREKEFIDELMKASPVKESPGGLHVRTAEADARIAAMQAQEEAVNKVIHDRLLRAEALKQGITADELVQREVTAKITPAGEAEVKAEWEKWKKVYGDNFAKAREDVTESVQEQKKSRIEKELDDRLRAGHAVRLLFEIPERPAQNVDGERFPASGPRDAKVTLVEFGDFQCPPCGAMSGIVEEALKPYATRVRYVFRQYPLSFHRFAWKAAEAALAAHAQGKFDVYARTLFNNQNALEVTSLKEYATRVGLDRRKFDDDLDSGRFGVDIIADKRAGDRAGVRGTPSFFLNGVRLGNDAYSLEGMRGAFDRALAVTGK